MLFKVTIHGVAVCSAAVLVLGGSVSVCGASVFSGTEVICGAAVFSGSGVAVITTGASLSSDGSLLLFLGVAVGFFDAGFFDAGFFVALALLVAEGLSLIHI